MNLRISILLVVVLLLFGGAYLVLRITDTGEPREREPWLYRIDESTLTHIVISHAGETINFDRRPGSINWLIQGDPDFPVFRDKWSGTPLLLSGPKVNRVLADNIEDLGAASSFGLDPPESVVQVTDYAGNSFEFHMGIPTPDGENQYVRLVGDDALFTVPEVWARVINSRVIEPPWGRLYQLELEMIRVVEVTHEDTTATYGLGPGGQWLIDADPPQPVAEEWEERLALLLGPRVDKRLAQTIEEPADYGLEPPLTRVIVARRGDTPVEFHLGDFTPDGSHRYARVLNTGDTSLYAILNSRTDPITDLATDPLYGPDPVDDSSPSS